MEVGSQKDVQWAARQVANPVFYLGEVVDELRANEFLPHVFKLPNTTEKMLFKLIPATIPCRGGIGAVLESKSVGKAGFNGSFRGK